MSAAKKKKVKLDASEQDIADNFDKRETVENFAEMKTMLQEAAREHIAKKERISIRINGKDLENIKKLAQREGLPYQTFITSILHKYVMGDLVSTLHSNSAPAA